jgi:hypothetical protein
MTMHWPETTVFLVMETRVCYLIQNTEYQINKATYNKRVILYNIFVIYIRYLNPYLVFRMFPLMPSHHLK